MRTIESLASWSSSNVTDSRLARFAGAGGRRQWLAANSCVRDFLTADCALRLVCRSTARHCARAHMRMGTGQEKKKKKKKKKNLHLPPLLPLSLI
jgi:hypothetical protein